jgi:ATP-dependent DNA helicase RecG
MLLKLLEDVAPAGERQAVCENRGSGVGAMVASLRQARLPDRVTLSRAEISQALGLDISIRKWLATMRDEGIIVATAQKIRSKNVRYELARR